MARISLKAAKVTTQAEAIPAPSETMGAAQPKTSRREQKKLRTRDAILDAASKSFATYGITGATIDEIAEQADVARATLFNYFPSKADMVAALAIRLDEDLFALIDLYLTKDLPFDRRIVGVFRSSGRHLEKNHAVARPLVAVSEQAWSNGSLHRLHYSTRKFMELIAGTHDIPVDSETGLEDEALTVCGEMLMGVYSNLIHNWRVDEAYPLERRMTAAAERLAIAIAAPKA